MQVLDLPKLKKEKTIEELYDELSRTPEKAEIINGGIVKLMATGDESNSAAFNIALSLKQYQRKTGFEELISTTSVTKSTYRTGNRFRRTHLFTSANVRE